MSKKSSTFAPHFARDDVSRSRAVVARQAHNLKVGGSIPPSATKEKPFDIASRWLFVYYANSDYSHIKHYCYFDVGQRSCRLCNALTRNELHRFGGTASER